jgi:hypothetical protein
MAHIHNFSPLLVSGHGTHGKTAAALRYNGSAQWLTLSSDRMALLVRWCTMQWAEDFFIFISLLACIE